jgi:hypothetical protein
LDGHRHGDCRAFVETKSEPIKELLKVSELDAAMATYYLGENHVRFDHGAIQ